MSNLCRTCGVDHMNLNILNLFEDTSKSRIMLKLLNVMTGLHLKKHKKLPDYICAVCQISLDHAYKFRTTCHSVQTKLKDIEILGLEQQLNKPYSIVDNPEEIDFSFDYFGMAGLDELSLPINEINDWTKEIDKFFADNKVENPKMNELNFLVNESDNGNGISENESINSINIGKDIIYDQSATPKQMQMISDSCKTLDDSKEHSMLPVLKDKEICSVKSEQSIKQYNTTNQPNHVKKYIKYICDICGHTFSSKSCFNAHTNRHQGLFPYECKLCPEKFNAVANLKRHMLKHSGTLPFACRFCERRFLDSYLRTRHERMHKNERPFKCSFCEKGFTSNYILRHHILTHTKERAFSCDLCKRKFKSKAALVKHYQTSIHLQNINNKTGIVEEVTHL